MSIEIVLHPKHASKRELATLLTELGFIRTEHLWAWPKGSSHFAWFDQTEYRSFDGVEATIYPPTEEAQANLGSCAWALHTRTRASASPADKGQQNHVIRTARRRFGGTFINDWYGRNRYTKVLPDPRDSRARGIYLTYTWITTEVRSVRLALPQPNKELEKLVGTELDELATSDPTRVLYNAIIPFAVAALETFLRRCFEILLQYDDSARGKLREETRKVEMVDVLKLHEGEKTIEEIIADQYSFQNLDSAHKAFRKWLSIDLGTILRTRKRIGSRRPILADRTRQLIGQRHAFVHHFGVDRYLRQEDVRETLDLVLAVIDTLVLHLEEQVIQGRIRS